MAHIHEKIDFTAEVFVVHQDKVLLRMHDKLKIWLSVGGHIELGEDPNEAAVREVLEEVGLNVTLWDPRTSPANSDEHWRELIPPVALGRHAIHHPSLPVHEHVTCVYFAKAISDAVTVHYEGDRSDEWRWFTRSELDALELRPNIRAYAEEALKTLGTSS